MELKAPTNIFGPSLIFSTLSPGDEVLYNYAYITNWQKYYFITAWTWEDGLWRADLYEDVLATFKTGLLQQSFYVTRSASTYDPSITDTYYPAKNAIGHLIQSISDISWYTNMNLGFFVVSLINSDNNAVGGVSYYAMTPAQYRAFANYLLQNTNDWMQTNSIVAAASELTADLIKTLNNPYQYITSLNWYPFDLPTAICTAITDIPFGWWSLHLNAYRMDTLYFAKSAAITIPKHPQAATRGSFLLYEPFSSYTLFLPPFGILNIPAGHIAQYSTFNAQICVDLATGKAALNLSVPNYVILRTIAELAIPIHISAMENATDLESIGVSTAAGAAASVTDPLINASNAISEWVSNLIGVEYAPLPERGQSQGIAGIANGIMAQNVTVTSIGSTGTLADYYINPIFELAYSELVNEDLTENGRPLCQTKQLSTLTGFCLCFNPDPQIAGATSTEHASMVEFLAGGFFIE